MISHLGINRIILEFKLIIKILIRPNNPSGTAYSEETLQQLATSVCNGFHARKVSHSENVE